MEKITKEINIGLNREKVFNKFVSELNEWWPKEYTWSQDSIKEIKIDGKKDGLCTETGPYGFRCDWGRVKELTENEKIELKWQIGPAREPVPNPDDASDIKVEFGKNDESATVLRFEHYNFENHGDGADDYRKMMGGKQGWTYILNKFKNYCEKTGQ